MSKKRILVVGGTGYLGQHLLQGLSEIRGTPYDLAFTHHCCPPQALLQAIPHSVAFHVNLQTGQGFDAISQTFGQVNSGVMSPAGISMDISKLVRTLDISPVPFLDSVRLMLETKAAS